MAGYSKNIAVIRAVRGGFSADGGALSGLVKAEKYGGYLRAEAVKINFAPLTSGSYVTGISDGVRVALCEGDIFEGGSDIDISCGFAALICFVRRGEVSPVAAAVCGDYSWALARIQAEIERREGAEDGGLYEDDAIAEDNYYEYGDGAKSGGAVREDSQQKAEPRVRKDEDDFGVRQGQKAGKAPIDLPRHGGEYLSAEGGFCGGGCGDNFAADNFAGGNFPAGNFLEDSEKNTCENAAENIAVQNNSAGGLAGCGGNSDGQNNLSENCAAEFFGQEGEFYDFPSAEFPPPCAADIGSGGVPVGGVGGVPSAEEEAAFHSLRRAQSSDKNNGLGEGSGHSFYSRMHAEIERLLSGYPREEKLEQTVQGSRWVRINYSGGRYYVFGVIYAGQSPAWVCYGVPSKNSSRPPASLAGMASYIPAGRHGYWVMYQNAQTGESVKIDN